MEDIQKTLENAARLAGEKGLVRFTRFLDPAEAELARCFAHQHGAGFSVWGGYERAERVVGCFFPAQDMPQVWQYPIVCLHSRYAVSYTHLRAHET